MSARRYALRDDQWKAIENLLPGREDTVGVTARDNRLFVEAVLFRYRAGIPWRDLPERFGDWKNVHRRHSRWSESGVLARLKKAHVKPVIPARKQRNKRRRHDRNLYKRRHLIENFFARLKQYRAIATRCDKRAKNFLGAIHLAAAVCWLN